RGWGSNISTALSAATRERPGLARYPIGCVVVLAEPRGAIPIVQQDSADGRILRPNDAVVAWEARRLLGNDAEPGRVVVAPGDQRCPGRRAQRGRMEVGVAQPVIGDAVEGRRRNDAAKGGGCGEPDIVGHD